MWVKKNENMIKEELQKGKERESKNKLKNTFKTGIWVFIIAFFVKILLSITLGVNYSPNFPPPYEVIDIKEIPNYFLEFLETGLFWSVGFMIIRFFSPNMFKDKSTSLICDKCFRMKNLDNELNCECKGNFLPLQNFEWIEAKEYYLIENMDWIYKYKIEKTKC